MGFSVISCFNNKMVNPALSVLPPSVRKERKKKERERNRKWPSVSHVTAKKRGEQKKRRPFLTC